MIRGMVSIIVPIYNIEEYLITCLDSIINQSYKNIEVLLVNDGSTDQSLDICKIYEEKDKRFRIINKKNGGLSDARNAGLEIAKGEFCYFLDGDDSIYPETIEVLIDQIDNVDILFFGYDKRNSNNEAISLFTMELHEFNLTNKESHIKFLLNELLNYNLCWEAWNKLFRMEIIDKYHIRFVDNKEIFAEDLLFALCYCTMVENAKSIPDILYHYSDRPNSIMNSGKNHDFKKYARLAENYEGFLKTHQKVYILKEFHRFYFSILHKYFTTSHLQESNIAFDSIENQNILRYCTKKYQKDLSNLIGDKKKKLIVQAILYRYHLSRLGDCLLCSLEKKEKNNWRRKKKNCIFLVGTEDFGNIGDHKIALVELAYLKKNFNEYDIFELSASSYNKLCNVMISMLKDGDLIFLTGGGNFGSLYPFSENIRRDVISKCTKQKIIMFPQSICYEENRFGILQLEISKKVYNSHEDLHLMFRDENSYQFAKANFKNAHSYLLFDIVLVDDHIYISNKTVRENKLNICMNLRKDKERYLSDASQEVILDLLKPQGANITMIDHQLPHHISIQKREKYVESFLQQYSNANLTITDRLHGMIFSIITNTPCIVFDNSNHKIQGAYETLLVKDNVHFLEKFEMKQFEQILREHHTIHKHNGNLYQTKLNGVLDVILHYKRD